MRKALLSPFPSCVLSLLRLQQLRLLVILLALCDRANSSQAGGRSHTSRGQVLLQTRAGSDPNAGDEGQIMLQTRATSGRQLPSRASTDDGRRTAEPSHTDNGRAPQALSLLERLTGSPATLPLDLALMNKRNGDRGYLVRATNADMNAEPIQTSVDASEFRPPYPVDQTVFRPSDANGNPNDEPAWEKLVPAPAAAPATTAATAAAPAAPAALKASAGDVGSTTTPAAVVLKAMSVASPAADIVAGSQTVSPETAAAAASAAAADAFLASASPEVENAVAVAVANAVSEAPAATPATNSNTMKAAPAAANVVPVTTAAPATATDGTS